MSFGDYRTRSNDVRSAARAKLAELRAERLARRRYAAPAAPAPQEEVMERAPAPSPTEGLADLRFTASSAAARFAAEAGRGVPDPAPPQAAPEPARAPGPAEPRRARAPMAGVSLSLNLLPGIGPGLIWLLQEQGVSSLADLAERQPEELRAVLGLLGPFVDIESWIAFAQERAHDPAGAQP